MILSIGLMILIKMGNVSIIGDPYSRNVYDDIKEKTYISCTRCKMALIQTIVPRQEYVDLSKGIKQTYTIRL